VVNGWQTAARASRTAEVVRDLLVNHYDPIYRQSMKRNFTGLAQPLAVVEWDGSEASLAAAAQRVAAL
jgi:tRNA 2-selenouridine synthase